MPSAQPLVAIAGDDPIQSILHEVFELPSVRWVAVVDALDRSIVLQRSAPRGVDGVEVPTDSLSGAAPPGAIGGSSSSSGSVSKGGGSKVYRNALCVPPSDVVNAYAEAAIGAAAPFLKPLSRSDDADDVAWSNLSDDGDSGAEAIETWYLCAFTARHWDIVVYRCPPGALVAPTSLASSSSTMFAGGDAAGVGGSARDECLERGALLLLTFSLRSNPTASF